ncbi:hypothetical protein Ocin01_04906 [Orchesella cincta]|uniref:Uncharacterized protein n=1 Tax=Orchesella cincta TaxID=48709 RepID=A0A1D2N942_ORCCI|nr:hypothetical protein Ocin01_04906 [Orchesella cincta]
MSSFIANLFSESVKSHQHLVYISILILIITTVDKVSSQVQQLPNTLPQPGGIQIFIPSQYGGSQPSLHPGYPMNSNPYGIGNAPTWSNSYSPVMSQFPPGSVGIGSYPMMQPHIAPTSLQSSFLSTVPQGYTLLPQSSQFSSIPPQGYSYPYPAVMGTGNLFNSQNIPQAVQVMPQMAGFGTVSPSLGRTVRILVPVYAPRPPSPLQSQLTPDPSQLPTINPNASTDPSQMAATDPASSVPPSSQTANQTDPNIPNTPSAAVLGSTPSSSNASSSSTSTDNSNANTSLSKINELIQAAANESDPDPDETKLLGNIVDIVKEALDVEKLRRKQGGMGNHDGSSDSTSAITKSVQMLISKLVQDSLTAQ